MQQRYEKLSWAPDGYVAVDNQEDITLTLPDIIDEMNRLDQERYAAIERISELEIEIEKIKNNI